MYFSLRSESSIISLLSHNFRFVLLLLRYINPLILVEAGHPIIIVFSYLLNHVGGISESCSGSWIWVHSFADAVVLLSHLKHRIKMSLITDNNFFLLWSLEVLLLRNLLLRIRVIIHLRSILVWHLLLFKWWFLVLAFHVLRIGSLSLKLLLQIML